MAKLTGNDIGKVFNVITQPWNERISTHATPTLAYNDIGNEFNVHTTQWNERLGIVQYVPPVSQYATKLWTAGNTTTNPPANVFVGAATPAKRFGMSAMWVELQGDFIQVALILGNAAGVVNRFAGARIAVSGDGTDKIQNALFAPGGGAIDVTFGGLPTIDIPAGTGSRISLVRSDWMDITAVNRTDIATAPVGSIRSDGTLPPALMVRYGQEMWTVADVAIPQTFLGRTGLGHTLELGQTWIGTTAQATPAMLTATWDAANPPRGNTNNSTGWSTTVVGIAYKVNGRIMTTMFNGDSTYDGGTDGNRTTDGITQSSCYPLSTKAQPIECINFGQTSKAFAVYSAGGIYAMDFVYNTHTVLELLSPNDWGVSPTLTDPQVAGVLANILPQLATFKAECETRTKALALTNSIPRQPNQSSLASFYDAATETKRLKVGTDRAAEGFIVIDTENAIAAPGVFPHRFISIAADGAAANDSVDGTHPSTTGYPKERVPVKAQIARWQAAYYAQP